MVRAKQDFHAFTIRFGGLANRIVTRVDIFPPFQPTLPIDQVPAGFESNALWDTGASKSCITRELAAQLPMTPVGSGQITHGGGQEVVDTYLLNLRLPNKVMVAGLLVSVISAQDGFGVLVGMDIISQGDLSITNEGGKTCMSFRIPSCHTLDFVQEVDWSQSNTPRNSLCPCGSGKKFKFCHGA